LRSYCVRRFAPAPVAREPVYFETVRVRRTFEERLPAKRDYAGGASEAGARTDLQPGSALLRRASENSAAPAEATLSATPLRLLEQRNHDEAHSTSRCSLGMSNATLLKGRAARSNV
jgi:hypothetical protein